VNQRTRPRPKLSEVLVCYNYIERLIEKEEDQLLSTEDDLFTIGTIILFREFIRRSSKGTDPCPYLNQYYTYTKSDIEVDIPITIKVQDKEIAT
jgi:hypothetical protein